MRVVLHLGTWKTGSAAIQAFLRNNPRRLARRGFVVPRFARRLDGHNALVEALRDPGDARLDALLGQVGAEARGRTVILSSEHYWPLKPAKLSRLAAGLRRIGAAPRMIAYIRPQEEMWASLYAQQAKNFRIQRDTRLWGDWSYLPREMVETGLYYDRCFRRMEEIFAAQVELRIYDRDRFPGGDAARDFAGALGLSPEGLGFARADDNPPFGWKGVAFSVWCGEFLWGGLGPPAERRRLRPALAATVRDMARRTGDADWRGRAPNFLDAAARRAIRDHYAEDNRRLATRCFEGDPPFGPVAAAALSPAGAEAIPDAEFRKARKLFLKRLRPSAAHGLRAALRRAG